MEQREGSKGRGAKGGEQREEKTGRFNINQFHFTLEFVNNCLKHCCQRF